MTKGYKYKVEDCITAYKNAYQKDLIKINDLKWEMFDIAKSKVIFKLLFWISDKDLLKIIDNIEHKHLSEFSTLDTLLFGYDNCFTLAYSDSQDLAIKIENDLKRFELVKNRYVWLSKNEADFVARHITKD